MSKLILTAPLETLERLAVEDLLHRRQAAAFIIECSDAKLTPALAKAAANAAAFRMERESFGWPVSPEALAAAAPKAGVRAETAELAANQLLAEGSIRPSREELNEQQAADFIGARLGSSPFLHINGVRPASEPAAVPAPEPAADGAPEYSHPSGHGRPPTSAAIRQAKADHAYALAEHNAVKAGKSAAVARAEAHQGYDAAWAAS